MPTTILLGAVGLGAIGGAFIIPHLRKYLSSDSVILITAIAASLVMVILANAPPKWAAFLVLLVLGVAWISALTTMNGTMQAILPNWVRGRALAIYLTVFNGSMALGSLLWGSVAQYIGIPATLVAGAVTTLLAALIFWRIKLPVGEADLTPSHHWPEPALAHQVEHDRGPVLILVEYQINAQQRADFLAVLQALSVIRHKDGAWEWGVTEETEHPEKVTEWFLVESWAEHLRQHHRLSNADVELQQQVLAFHQGSEKPQVRHLIGIK